MAHVVVIGAGPGGLAAAMQLTHSGCAVTVIEARDAVGGRTSGLTLGPYTFDRGPTFLNMPHIVEQTFARGGASMADELTTVALDPMVRLHFSDVHIDMTTHRRRMRDTLERLFPGEGAGYDAFMAAEQKHFEAISPLLLHAHDALWHYAHPRFLRAVPHMGIGQSLMQRLQRYFRHPTVQIAFTFQAKYLGMSPWECPAAFSMLAYMEHAYGVHHPIGGVHAIPRAMQRVVVRNGGSVRLGTPVRHIVVRDRTVVGVALENGETIPCDAVVINADIGRAVSLFPPNVLRTHTPERMVHKKWSCSTCMLYLGVRKSFAHMPHHTIIFSPDYRAFVDHITRDMVLPPNPSVYVHNASVTDPTLAPQGHSALYVLAPVPNNRSGIDWKRCAEEFCQRMRAVIASAGFSVATEDIAQAHVITPEQWEHDHNVYAGATFSLGHQLRQMLYFRPHNRMQDVRNCWLVGGGTHPGSGLPTILSSAHITVHDMLTRYRRGRRWV